MTAQVEIAPSQTERLGIEARNIQKAFGHVQALDGADFACRLGEVTALIGDNGAGKSTLVKILSGALSPDRGELSVCGEPYAPRSPAEAQVAGVQTVYQDLALAPDLGPAENMFLGREVRRRGLLGRLGFLDDRAMRDEARAVLERLSVTARADARSVRSMSGGQRQGVAVARAVTWAEKVILLDEPTAALGHVQTQNVLNLIRRVADSGLAVVLISHSMPDVLAVADRIEVLRLGRSVARFTRSEASVERLVSAMTGGQETPNQSAKETL